MMQLKSYKLLCRFFSLFDHLVINALGGAPSPFGCEVGWRDDFLLCEVAGLSFVVWVSLSE